MKLTLHIGSGKTGSSSIQKALHQSRRYLKSTQNTCYLGLMLEEHKDKQSQPFEWQITGGWPIFLRLDENIRISQLCEALDDQIKILKNAGCNHCIISNESIFGRYNLLEPFLSHCKKQEYALNIILFLRRHYEWAFSAYSQWCLKHKTNKGRIKSFSEWLSSSTPSFYHEALKWRNSTYIESFSLINYDKSSSIFLDFEGASGIQFEDSISRVTSRQNKALGVIELILVSLYNDHQDEPILPVETREILRLLSESKFTSRKKSFNLKEMLPNDADINQLYLRCRDDFLKVNDLFSQLGQPQFEDVLPESIVPPDTFSTIGNLSPSDAHDELLAAVIAIINKLAQHNRANIRHISLLDARLKKLESLQSATRETSSS